MNIYLLPTKKYAKPALPEQHKRIAYHAAGQAAAIYLRNKRMNLPFVSFQVLINDSQPQQHRLPTFRPIHGKRYQIRIEGGRLIKNLPTPSREEVDEPINPQNKYRQQAFDADIINILAGPVAEAKYVAERDDEIITPRLVNFNTLGFYNGMDEMTTVLNYMQSRGLSPAEQQKAMINLYLTSFCFVGEDPVWRAIKGLADHFLTTQQTVLESDEIGAVLDGIKPKLASAFTG